MHVRTRTWFSFVVIISLLFIGASRFAIFDPLEDAVLIAAEPIESALGDATSPLADFVNNLTDVNRLSDENQAVREENEALRAENVRLREAETENQQLRQLLGVREQRPDDVLVAAGVFAHDPSNLKDVVAIDRGREDGLQEGMIVLSSQGSVLGSVTKVLDRAAWVTLITDPTSAVSALIQESRAPGIVVGSPDGTLTMEFVEETADVKEGDLVLTSGLGGSHPPGEVVGRVAAVEQAAQELFQSVRIEPIADLSRLETVFVLASFLPQELEQP